MDRWVIRIRKLVATGLLVLALAVVPMAPAAALPAAAGPMDTCTSSAHGMADGTVPCPEPAASKAATDSCCVSPQCAPVLAGVPAVGEIPRPTPTGATLTAAEAGLPDGVGIAPALPPPRRA